MYEQQYNDGSRGNYKASQKTLSKVPSYGIGVAACFIASFWILWTVSNGAATAVLARGSEAPGLYGSHENGDGKRLIDFSLKIAGFTASRAGTLGSAAKSGQPEISLGTGPVNTKSDPGDEKQNYQWDIRKFQNITATDKRVSGGSGSERPIHKGGVNQQRAIDYAWSISHDKDFIYLLKAENGDITIDREGDKVGSNGYRDYGYCQINKGFHPEIVKDPRFFTDYKWQLDQCYRLYKNGTVFYGLKRFKTDKKYRDKIKATFTWIT